MRLGNPLCAWRSGRKVRKAIGFDSGVKDCRRYAEKAANDMTSYTREHRLLEPHSVNELVASTPKGQEVPVEVLDAYLEVVTEGRKL